MNRTRTDDQFLVLAIHQTDSHIISDSYIVRLDDQLEAHEVDAHHSIVNSLHQADARVRALKATASSVAESFDGLVHKYHIGQKHRHARKAFKGYSGHFSESTVDAIRALKGVKYVERDSIVWASEIAVERGAPWVSRPSQLSALRSRSVWRAGGGLVCGVEAGHLVAKTLLH